jgi:hypothetical protein
MILSDNMPGSNQHLHQHQDPTMHIPFLFFGIAYLAVQHKDRAEKLHKLVEEGCSVQSGSGFDREDAMNLLGIPTEKRKFPMKTILTLENDEGKRMEKLLDELF